MRRILPWLLLAALVVAGAVGIALLPGSVRLEVAGTRVDAATPTALLLLVLLLAAFYALMRLAGAVLGLRRRMGKRRRRRLRREGDAALVRALVALAANQPRDAVTQSARARASLGDTPYAMLAAARAHWLAGQKAEAASCYGQLAERADSALIGLRGQAEMAEAASDWILLAALALKAEQVAPGAPWVRELRATLAARGRDMAAVARLAG